MQNERSSLVVKIYTFSRQGVLKLYEFANACLVGFWLGVLDRGSFYELDRAYFDGEQMYRRESYNRQGLFEWEKAVIQEHFSGCKQLLLIGAGGGREVLALARLGYAVDAYEYNPKLVESAQSLLVKDELPCSVQFCPCDRCPPGDPVYDGLIVGWGAYMHIPGRQRRVAFLQELRARARPGAPVLLSFFVRRTDNRHFRLVHFIANLLRRLQFRELVELGDDMDPNYNHHFTQDEIAAELCIGGFKLVAYRERFYGHAVGIAV